MSRSSRPSKDYRLQHRRMWVQQKQHAIQHVAPQVVLDAVSSGLEDHKENDPSGEHLSSDACFCIACFYSD